MFEPAQTDAKKIFAHFDEEGWRDMYKAIVIKAGNGGFGKTARVFPFNRIWLSFAEKNKKYLSTEEKIIERPI